MTVAGKDQKWMLKLVGSVIYMCVCIYKILKVVKN